MANIRITEEFVKCLLRVKEATQNNPKRLDEALDQNPDLAGVIRELAAHDRRLQYHRAHSPRRYILQAHPAFAAARSDYQARWGSAEHVLFNWEHKRQHGQTFDEWLDEREAEIGNLPASENSTNRDLYLPNLFDPADPEDLAAAQLSHFLSWAEDKRQFAESDGSYELSDLIESGLSALRWSQKTLETDLRAAEQRWRKLRVIAVPKPISDPHPPKGREGLFALLDDARRAYVHGSPLAALALCRALTELLIKKHYLQNSPKDLRPAIRFAEDKFPSLKKENLGAKIELANDVLHSNPRGKNSLLREEVAVVEWFSALQRLIEKAPPTSK